jgi:hypothetical protein
MPTNATIDQATSGKTQQVAHLSWGIVRGYENDPAMAEFFDNIDRVHEVAARTKGFVDRIEKSEEDVRKALVPDIPNAEGLGISSLTVWETTDDLEAFVHKTLHGHFLKRKSEWFRNIDKPTYVIWPIEPGHVPTIAEARERRDMLVRLGPTDEAYDFQYAAEIK